MGALSSWSPALPADRAVTLEAWMQQYGTRVLHLAYFYMKDRQLAEDVAQDVFIKAYQAMDDFRGDSAAFTWLYRITVNLCRDRLRMAYYRHTVLPGELPVGPAIEDGPEEAAIKGSQRQAVAKLVLELPDHYRESLALYYFQELSTTEIAHITGEPEGTIKTRLHRARKILLGRLQKAGVAP